MENFYKRSGVEQISNHALQAVPDDAPYIVAYFKDDEMFWTVEGANKSQMALLAVELIRAFP